MSDKDKQELSDSQDKEDKTSSKENEKEDKTSKNDKSDLDSKTLFYQKKKAQEQRDEEKEKREELEAKLKELEAKKSDKKTNNDGNSALEEKIKAIEFTIKHPALKSDVINEVLDVAERKGIKAEKALENPMVKAYIEKVEEEEKSKEATPTKNRSAISSDEDKEDYDKAVEKAKKSGSSYDWADVISKRINK